VGWREEAPDGPAEFHLREHCLRRPVRQGTSRQPSTIGLQGGELAVAPVNPFDVKTRLRNPRRQIGLCVEQRIQIVL
jgi:hypothetical protein